MAPLAVLAAESRPSLAVPANFSVLDTSQETVFYGFYNFFDTVSEDSKGRTSRECSSSLEVKI